MPTTVTSKIGATNSPVTMDYSTLQAWEDASPASLVTDDKIWRGEVYNQGELVVNGVCLTISGITTDSTRYVELTTATGASFKDHANKLTNALKYDTTLGAAIRNSGGYTVVISNTVAYTRISNLMLQGGTSGASYGLNVTAGGTNALYENLIVNTRVAAGRGIVGWANSVIRNCLAYSTVNFNDGAMITAGGGGGGIYGCTAAVCSDKTGSAAGFGGSYGTPTVKNCASFGFANDATSVSASYSATNDASPTSGFTGSLTYADQFEGTTSSAPDFRAKATGSLDLNGTPDLTNTPTDIVGQTRHVSTPTIGAWEVASGTVIPVFMNQYRQRVA